MREVRYCGYMTSTSVPVPQQLTAEFGWMIGSLTRRYMGMLGDALTTLPGGVRAYHVLLVADTKSCGNQLQLASLLGIDRTVMTHLIDDLEGAGLVVRVPDPNDRRAKVVQLTDSGRQTLCETSAVAEEVAHTMLAPLAQQERDQFVAAVRELAQNEPIECQIARERQLARLASEGGCPAE